jgi:hypothetical protein
MDFGLDFVDHAGEQQLEVEDTIKKTAREKIGFPSLLSLSFRPFSLLCHIFKFIISRL